MIPVTVLRMTRLPAADRGTLFSAEEFISGHGKMLASSSGKNLAHGR
jgi:hypothetical protein